MDQTVAIIWSIVGVISVALCIFGWVVLSRTSSRKNGVHAFVASLLASRVILCVAVVPLLVFHVFLNSDWSVLGCHALYWLWTITWVSDITAVCASFIWGLVKLRHMRSTFRLGATIAISGVWLIATTSAGCLAYFNQRIKDKTDLKLHGCDVMPKLDETALSIGLFALLLLGILISSILLISFLVLLTLSSRRSAKHKAESNSQLEGNGSVDGQVVNGVIPGHISREPSRLESIEEYKVRRGAKSQCLILNETEQRQLTDWRNCLSAIFASMVMLDIMPHLVLLSFPIFRHEHIASSDVILMSCHLANCFLLPVIMVSASNEYRTAALSIVKGRPTQPAGPQGTQRTHQTPRNSGREPSNGAANGQHQPNNSNQAFSGIEIIIDSPSSSPNISRSESRLSRLEWKEHMLKSARIPVAVYSEPQPEMQTEVEVERRSEGEVSLQGSSETDSDMAGSVNGCFTDSDIDRVLETTPPPEAITEEKSNRPISCTDIANDIAEKSPEHGGISTAEAEIVSCARSDTASEKSFKQSSKSRKRKEKSDRRAKDIYATISRALGLEDGGDRSHDVVSSNDVHRPLSRSAMVYSPNNPFLKTLQEEEEGDIDTESERSVEAEIVAITIRGRGSLKRKLKKRGLRQRMTRVREGNDVTSYDVPNGEDIIHYQNSPSTGYGIKKQMVEVEPRPVSRISTNPFISDMEGAGGGHLSYSGTNESYTREWVETRQDFTPYEPSNRHSNPFLNYSFESESIDPEDIRKRSSSNPFLQDITTTSGDMGEPLQTHSHVPEDEFVTRSAPTTPPTRRRGGGRSMKPAALAVTIVELLKSKDEGLARYDTGHKARFTNSPKGLRGDNGKQNGAYVTEYL